MIFIYQIGSFPLFFSLEGENGKGVQIKRSLGWDNPEIDFSGIEGSVSLLPPSNGLLKNSKASIRGILVNVPEIKMSEALNYIKSLGGRRNIQVIGCQIANKSVEDGPPVMYAGDLTWLVTNGVISGVKMDDTWAGSEDTLSTLPVSIDIELNDYWKHLSPLYWEYRPRHTAPINIQAYDSAPWQGLTTFVHPRNMDEVIDGSVFYRWPSTLSDMDPAMWGMKYDGHLGGVGSDFAPFHTVDLFVDPQAWQGVSTLTAFTGVTPTETLEIVVTRASGVFKEDTVEEISSLDLSVVDTNLAAAGYDGLRASDILYTGLVDPLPGYIVREGERIEGLSLSWSYPASYPGEVSNGSVKIEYRGSLGGVAYLHDFLVY